MKKKFLGKFVVSKGPSTLQVVLEIIIIIIIRKKAISLEMKNIAGMDA